MAAIDEDNRSWAKADGWDSLYFSLISLPAACMLATLVSDLLYWGTARALWLQASEWLLGASLATGAFAATDSLIRYVGAGWIRPSRICWMHVVGNMLALLLSLSNLIYRLNEEPGQAVVPAGISLTAIAVCLLLLTARLGRETAAEVTADDLEDADLIWDDPAPPDYPGTETSAVPSLDSALIREEQAARAPSGDEDGAAPAVDFALIWTEGRATALPAAATSAVVPGSARRHRSPATRARKGRPVSPPPAPAASSQPRAVASKGRTPRPS